jgi:hypothetical protein
MAIIDTINQIENKFNYSKIYKLTSNHTDKIYIGSTTERLLCMRLAKHRNNYKRALLNLTGMSTASKLLELGDVKIELIEYFPCQQSIELRNRERHYIELHRENCVNKNIPGRSADEYRQTRRIRSL